MKKTLFRALALIMAIGCPVLLTACGNDNEDEPTPAAPAYSEVNVSYTLDLSEDYYDLWDIQVTYTGIGGETKTETVDTDWVMEYTYTPDMEVPGEFVFNVVAVAKNPLPDVDADKIYHFARSTQFVATGRTASGTTAILGGSITANTSSFDTKGDKLSSRLKDGMKITEGTYTVSK